VFAEARFRAIHEAYTVLNNAEKRALYDYDRWLSGRFTKNAAIVTPEYLLQEIHKLNAHIAAIDVYRMNKELLHQYLLFMLSDEKIAVILLKGNTDTIHGLAEGIIKASSVLPVYFAKEVLQRLKMITVSSLDDELKVDTSLKRLAREHKLEKVFPWLALAITLLLCVAMYFFSKK
jgi:metal-responsive CopG/Arc/MetJ family transcriptional regulator